MEQLPESTARPLPLYFLLLLHVLLGIGGLYGGVLLVGDPSGRWIQMPLEWLAGSPFRDFMIPGIILLIFNGFLPILIAWGLIVQPASRWAEALNLYPERHWAWTFSLYSGIILAIWINVQLILLGKLNLLHPIYGLWAIFTIVLTMLPGVMQYYKKN